MQPAKALVVDDSALMHRIYDVLLRGLPVLHADDGAEALERLAEDPEIDLVLLDINMPKLDGFGVLERLRARGDLDRLAVIVVTTEGAEADAARGLAAGAAAYLTKPFRGEEIRAAIAGIEFSPRTA
ncbi:MAG: response regulator [Thermoanaerobaculia bacterium]